MANLAIIVHKTSFWTNSYPGSCICMSLMTMLKIICIISASKVEWKTGFYLKISDKLLKVETLCYQHLIILYLESKGQCWARNQQPISIFMKFLVTQLWLMVFVPGRMDQNYTFTSAL